MSLRYHQFFLSENSDFVTEEKITELFLKNNPSLGFIRLSLNLEGPQKSICVLCKSEKNISEESEIVKKWLLSQTIPLNTANESISKEFEEDDKETSDSKDTHHHHGESHHHHPHHDHHWIKAALGLICGLTLLAFSIASFNIPMIAYYAITGASTLITLFLGYTVYRSALRALREKKWDMSLLYTLSTLTIVGVSIASIFIPGLPMMIESAPLILGLWHLGEGVEHSLLHKVENKLDIRDCAPLTAKLKKDPQTSVSVKTLLPNEIIIIKQGEVIPIDGVLNQPAWLYTTRIDGSPAPQWHEAGTAVKAGMCFVSGASDTLEMRVTQLYQESYLSLIAQNIKKANQEKAPIEKTANLLLKYFIPTLIGVAAISGIVIGILFPPSIAIQCVISVLVSACPCALSLITPMAVKIGMKKAAEKGVHFKDGKVLQAVSKIDTVVFDLNGTLTKGAISVESLEISDQKFLQHVALLERQSKHPVAKTICAHLSNKNITLDESLKLTSVDDSDHAGILGFINGEKFIIGNRDMLRRHHIEIEIDPLEANSERSAIYIVRNSTIMGKIILSDPLREDAIATVKKLQALGKSVYICTGADNETAKKYAVELGIPEKNICANTVGATKKTDELSKEQYIQTLQLQGHKIAMVGDSANDISAIRSSDVGIAVRSEIGEALTEANAGITLQQGSLFPIATAFDISKKTRQNIYQNLAVSLTYNLTITLIAAGLFVALGFTLNPAIGIALVILESAFVLGNLYRFKRQKSISLDNTAEATAKNETPEANTATKISQSLFKHCTTPKTSPGPIASKKMSTQPTVSCFSLFANKAKNMLFCGANPTENYPQSKFSNPALHP